MNYYWVTYQENPRNGVCYGLPDDGPLMFELVPKQGPVEKWKPLELELRDGALCSFACANIGGRLCSPELRALFETHAGPKDELQWLPVTVRDGRKKHPYFMLHFPKVGRVVDREHSLYTDPQTKRNLIWAAFNGPALAGRNIFSYGDQNTSDSIYVSEAVKQAIQDAKLTGMNFKPVKVYDAAGELIVSKPPAKPKASAKPKAVLKPPKAARQEPKRMKTLGDHLESLRAPIAGGDWDAVEAAGRQACEKLANVAQVRRIAAANLSAYEAALGDAWRETLATAKDLSAKALYFEFDMDNGWSSDFFPCNSYSPEDESSDDWAGDWSESISGPDFAELGEIYQTDEGTFDASDLSRGTTIYLVARTIATCGRALPKKLPAKLPICAAYHDQELVYRLHGK